MFLALAVIVFAGGPSFFIPSSFVPLDVRDEICALEQAQHQCTPSIYRTFDGSCNNLANPQWGMANTAYLRLLPPAYSDGYSAFLKSVTGNDLPSARVISKAIFGELSVPDPEYTIIMMQFGQLMAHDMSFLNDEYGDDCCSLSGKYINNSSQCYAISVPSNDSFYKDYHVDCMNFTRSMTDHDLQCNGVELSPAQQISTVTGYLDLSLIYGNSVAKSNSVRSFVGGRLTTIVKNGQEFPPADPNPWNNCFLYSPDDICFYGGDDRLNQNPHLTVVHIHFIREHNRIADALAELNPHWNDEKIYQEARRINIAEYQYISYYEWLPIFLGTENMINLGMIYNVSGGDYVNDYDESVNGGVFNEHAGAAFRFFHTQIEGRLNLYSDNRDIVSTIALSEVFDNGQKLFDNFDALALGMVTQESQLTDSNFDTQIREFLDKHQREYGDDLRSIDIQRSRDHGIAKYNDFREFCGLPRAIQWSDYSDLISSDDLVNLQSVYEDVDDVELPVGAALEAQIDVTTLAGPTILCILNKQFYNTRVGDRYFFESGSPDVAFTNAQLAEIRKSSYARIFCDNSRNISGIQPQAFRTYVRGNDVVSCDEIPKVDLSLWKE